MAPNQAKVAQGLLRDDLFTVVHEQFATDTVDYADIVPQRRPSSNMSTSIGSYGHYYVMFNAPRLPPR